MPRRAEQCARQPGRLRAGLLRILPVGKAWSSVFGVPNDASLLGDTAVLQTFSLNFLAFPAKTEVTNGMHITFGK